MEQIRKPLRGTFNIIRFNWQFYALSCLLILFLFVLKLFINHRFDIFINVLILLISIPILISLAVSLYVYDLSSLYSLSWLNNLQVDTNKTIVNINAGFDETSELLNHKFPGNHLIVYDFYDPAKHTEVSIKRARKAYPPYKNTLRIHTADIPLNDHSADFIFLIFAAHEIRNCDEKIIFFHELNRVLQHNGKVIITEHLRNVSNFLAYNIGFLHFFGKQGWLNVFRDAGFIIHEKIKITPFVTTFILEKNGSTS